MNQSVFRLNVYIEWSVYNYAKSNLEDFTGLLDAEPHRFDVILVVSTLLIPI